ncbi:hypothetical protein [Nocardiopsis sp. YSL2]|uniref:hypothetical protein n=1 Tax=Nocardiopsis sp. YSL2 TaxID=2939492 RepID=UPI0026F4694D|nr:hypothetical protein [Nocardiopsis sp. YSL2]
MDSSVTHTPRADTVRAAHQLVVQAGAELEKLLAPAPTIPAPAAPQEMTVSQRQARTLAAIASLVASHPDMPTVDWHVSDHTPEKTDGQIYAEADDERRRAGVAAWGKLLGCEVTEKRSRDDRWTQVEANASSGGVDVRIWAHVDRTPKGAKSDG